MPTLPTLDERVSSLVSRARLLEQALHSPDGWSISRGGQEVPARRDLLEHGVVFTAYYSEPGEYGADAWLLQHGEFLSYLLVPPITLSGGTLTFCWELVIEDTVAA